jgi:hypothetical protein
MGWIGGNERQVVDSNGDCARLSGNAEREEDCGTEKSGVPAGRFAEIGHEWRLKQVLRWLLPPEP